MLCLTLLRLFSFPEQKSTVQTSKNTVRVVCHPIIHIKGLELLHRLGPEEELWMGMHDRQFPKQVFLAAAT